MIQAVILAGGLGTRMRPHTETVPKPMLPVRGRPFIEHQIEFLRHAGFHRFLLLVGWLGEQIEQYFGDGRRLGVSMRYSYEPTPLGTGGALRNAAGKLDPEFVVVNGDTLLEIDYAGLVEKFQRSGAMAVIAASLSAGPGAGNLQVAEDGTIIGYSKRRPAGRYVDAGVSVLRREVLDGIPPDRVCSFEEEVLPKLIASREAIAAVTEAAFFDMGTPAGLAALEAHLA
jgi:mannose-1-phosphate guanylyltransferase